MLQVVYGNVNSKVVLSFIFLLEVMTAYKRSAHKHTLKHTATASVTAGGGGYVIRHQVNSISVAR